MANLPPNSFLHGPSWVVCKASPQTTGSCFDLSFGPVQMCHSLQTLIGPSGFVATSDWNSQNRRLSSTQIPECPPNLENRKMQNKRSMLQFGQPVHSQISRPVLLPHDLLLQQLRLPGQHESLPSRVGFFQGDAWGSFPFSGFSILSLGFGGFSEPDG